MSIFYYFKTIHVTLKSFECSIVFNLYLLDEKLGGGVGGVEGFVNFNIKNNLL